MTVLECRRALAKKFSSLESPAFEARQLICGLLQISQKDLLCGERVLTKQEQELVEEKAVARLEGQPLQYLLGEWEFFGLPFIVGQGVLIPRADTEVLCDFALEYLSQKNKTCRVIDLCSGSGCIAITTALKTQGIHQVFALEHSEDALVYLNQNVIRNDAKVTILQDDVLNPHTEETDFDLILSNPPYLSEEDMTCLQQEVTFEPSMALIAGKDGYLFYEQMTPIWKERLAFGGVLAYEVGIHQAQRVCEILKDNGFTAIEVRQDLNKIDRVVLGKKE